MWSFPVYASHSWSECTLPVTTRTMPTNAMSNNGTPRISVGVNSDTTGLPSAHTPIAARPARVKPMKLAPLSPRKIVAPPGRKLYGRNPRHARSEEHTSELQSPCNLVCRLLLEKKKIINMHHGDAALRAPPVYRTDAAVFVAQNVDG